MNLDKITDKIIHIENESTISYGGGITVDTEVFHKKIMEFNKELEKESLNTPMLQNAQLDEIDKECKKLNKMWADTDLGE